MRGALIEKVVPMADISDLTTRVKEIEDRMNRYETRMALSEQSFEHMGDTLDGIKAGINKLNGMVMKISLFVILSFVGALLKLVMTGTLV